MLVGTSGYSYKEWKGRFYPDDLKVAEMLRFYGTRFPTVEINNTFYRMPSKSLLAHWSEEVPGSFRFVLKGSRRISHEKRLRNAGEEVDYLFQTASALGDKLGPILFQLPPFQKKDAERLRGFLAGLPRRHKTAFEFRHESWFDEEIYEALRAHGAALCIADTGEPRDPPLVATAGWGYLRLRRADYDEDAIAAWVDRVGAQPWDEAYVFFKHEDEGRGPELAARFTARLRP